MDTRQCRAMTGFSDEAKWRGRCDMIGQARLGVSPTRTADRRPVSSFRCAKLPTPILLFSRFIIYRLFFASQMKVDETMKGIEAKRHPSRVTARQKYTSALGSKQRIV